MRSSCTTSFTPKAGKYKKNVGDSVGHYTIIWMYDPTIKRNRTQPVNGKSLSLVVAGLPLLAFGIVWIIFVNPRIQRIPETYSSETIFQGTYQMSHFGQDPQIATLRIDAKTNTKSIENNRIHLVENIYGPTMELEIPSLELPTYSIDLTVDRRNRDYIDRDGKSIDGKFAFPLNLEKNNTYYLWNNLAETVLDYKFIRSKKIYDIETYEFRGAVLNLPKKEYPFTPASALIKDLWPTLKDYEWSSLDYSTKVNVEPKSGIIIDRTDRATLNYINQDLVETPTFISVITFTEQTKLNNAKKATKKKRYLAIYGLYYPYAMIIIGALLVIFSVSSYLRISFLRYKT